MNWEDWRHTSAGIAVRQQAISLVRLAYEVGLRHGAEQELEQCVELTESIEPEGQNMDACEYGKGYVFGVNWAKERIIAAICEEVGNGGN